MGKTENDMEIYQDKQTTTLVATPLELARILTDMLREDFVSKNEPTRGQVNPVVFEDVTETKTKGVARLVIKLQVKV